MIQYFYLQLELELLFILQSEEAILQSEEALPPVAHDVLLPPPNLPPLILPLICFFNPFFPSESYRHSLSYWLIRFLCIPYRPVHLEPFSKRVIIYGYRLVLHLHIMELSQD